MKLSHVDKEGRADMVDISSKDVIHREAEASGKIFLSPQTLDLIKDNLIKKGDVLAVARIAGITGAKRTSESIPLCHNIPINKINIDFDMEKDGIRIISRTVCDAKTGIEMEAITAVSIAALTIYDMCKAVDKQMRISDIILMEKRKNGI